MKAKVRIVSPSKAANNLTQSHGLASRDQLEDLVAGLNLRWPRIPWRKDLRPAIDTDGTAVAHILQGSADLFGVGLALPQPDIAARGGEVAKTFGKVLAVAAGGQQQAREADRINDDIGARLLGEVLVIGVAHRHCDPDARRQLARRQHRQDRCIVAPAADDETGRALDMDGLLDLVARGVAANGCDTRTFRNLDRLFIRIDDDDLADCRAGGEQLRHRILAGTAKAGEDDVTPQRVLDSLHAPILPAALEQKLGGGAEEDKPKEDADRRDQE